MKLLSWIAATFLLYAASAAVGLISAEAVPSHAQRLLGSASSADYENLRPAEQPEARSQQLNRVLAANPRETSARIELGLLDESQGNMAEAERDLLEAARLDHQHLPAWTLANFYFRRGRSDGFWKWAQGTTRLNYDDLRPLLRLAETVEPDPGKVVAKLGEAADYPLLDTLIEQGQMDQAQHLARILMPRPGARRDAMLALSTHQIAHGNASAAMELWNWIRPASGALDQPPDGQGFRLKLSNNPGVDAEWSPGSIVFRFDGMESDTFPLFDQAVSAPVAAVRYKLDYEFSSSADGLNFSLEGAVQPAAGGVAMFHLPPARASREPLRLVWLRLYYHRKLGIIPLQGEIILRRLQLTQEEP